MKALRNHAVSHMDNTMIQLFRCRASAVWRLITIQVTKLLEAYFKSKLNSWWQPHYLILSLEFVFLALTFYVHFFGLFLWLTGSFQFDLTRNSCRELFILKLFRGCFPNFYWYGGRLLWMTVNLVATPIAQLVKKIKLACFFGAKL